MSQVTYNDYVFPDRSNFQITESLVYDASDRTVIGTRFVLRLQTIIVNEEATTLGDNPAAAYVHYARQRISKAGQRLIIEHEGFGPTLDINAPAQGAVKDIAWGPKPRVIEWNPVGHTNSVEITWEVEWMIPICDGTQPPSFTGLSSFSYGITFDIDQRGYTTRVISGSMEIAMTRYGGGRNLVDSIDNYRNRVNFQKPANFERRISWQVSDDKRSANFTIIDSEIASPNAWPAGVVSISASHRAGWQRSSVARIVNTISATIELSPDEHKSRAWMIFRGMVNKRIGYATPIAQAVFIEGLDVIEDIFSNTVSFQLSYRIMGSAEGMGGIAIFFQATGLFQPISDAIDDWAAWDNSVKHLQPFRGLNSDRGVAELRHDWQSERLIDLCMQNTLASTPYQEPPTQPAYQPPVLCNPRPAPMRSWLSFEATLTYYEEGSDHTAVEIKANDIRQRDYNPNEPDAGWGVSDGSVRRFTVNNAGTQEFVWTGKAERVGYPIRKPGRIRIGNQFYSPVGKGVFSQAFMGMHFCQPKYAAAWKQRYRLDNPITELANPADINGGVE